MNALILPPESSLFCRHGSFSCWAPKSNDFQNCEELILAGEVLVVHIDASSLFGWSYHFRNEVFSGVWSNDHYYYESDNDFLQSRYKISASQKPSNWSMDLHSPRAPGAYIPNIPGT